MKNYLKFVNQKAGMQERSCFQWLLPLSSLIERLFQMPEEIVIVILLHVDPNFGTLF